MLISQINNYCSPIRQNINFGNVPKVYKKALMVLPAKDVERLLYSYPDPYLITGYFPKDILQGIKKKSKTSEELGNNIRSFNKAFSDQAASIRSFETTVIKRVQTLDLVDYIATALLLKTSRKLSQINYVDYPIKYFLTIEEMNKKLNNTEFNNVMKKVGAIPEDGNVSFEFAGKGTYKDCFKVRFLDKNNEDVVHPKAFVIGHDPHLGEKCNKILKKRMSDYIEGTDYRQFVREVGDKIFAKTNIDLEIKLSAINSIRAFYDKDYKSLYYFNGPSVFSDFDDINGIFAECNAALKIRKDLGKDIGKSNMITPYIFDLKNQCGLLEFADSQLPPVRTMYYYSEHGLNKIDERAENFKQGRCIDYGCIFPNVAKYTDKYYD